MTTELIKTSPQTVQELRNMPSNQLEEFAENKSKEILILIQKSIEKVSDAKRDAEEANNMKSGFLLGRTTKKADAVSAALLRTNEAVAELAKLQKEAITFTCISIKFASVMHQTMARLMATGFRDVHGNFRQLDENCQEFVQHILDEADKFVKNQMRVEDELSKQSSAIYYNRTQISTIKAISAIALFLSLLSVTLSIVAIMVVYSKFDILSAFYITK